MGTQGFHCDQFNFMVQNFLQEKSQVHKIIKTLLTWGKFHQ